MTKLYDPENNGYDDGSKPNTDGARTKLWQPETGSGTTIYEPFEGTSSQDKIEPVVAWLVIIAGPGIGRSIPLSYGMSTIGRGDGNRLVLDFGDDRISETDHFSVVYDGENRDFHVVPGRGKNLVYLEGKPLLNSQILTVNTDLRLGATTLRFVPFCSKEWDWAGSQASAG